nr:MAG TPA: hypothetical protein [Caudoviricetes sp.]
MRNLLFINSALLNTYKNACLSLCYILYIF